MPHLHAAHWMISSVVPVKLPVTRAYSGAGGFDGGPWPLVWLAVAFWGRISAAGRTWAAHVASDGSAEPGGNVPKWVGADRHPRRLL